MESRVNAKVQQHQLAFKRAVADLIAEQDIDATVRQKIAQFVYDYPVIELVKEDFAKRSRMKNIVPLHERCTARRAEGGEQCTRKRRDGCLFCGTHVKGTPHGVVEQGGPEDDEHCQVEVTAREIKGIIYYVDQAGNVYRTEDVVQNKTNPKVIAKYVTLADGSLAIPEFSV